MNKLKPCPFCGTLPIIEYWSSDGWMHMVKCPNYNCKVSVDGYPTGHDLDAVKEAWNRRANDESR